jgi:hypothetical protein
MFWGSAAADVEVRATEISLPLYLLQDEDEHRGKLLIADMQDPLMDNKPSANQ